MHDVIRSTRNRCSVSGPKQRLAAQSVGCAPIPAFPAHAPSHRAKGAPRGPRHRCRGPNGVHDAHPRGGNSTTSPAEQAPQNLRGAPPSSGWTRTGTRPVGAAAASASASASASATNDGSGHVATTPAETSSGIDRSPAEAGAPSEAGRPAETGSTRSPVTAAVGQPRSRKPAAPTATTATTGDLSEATGSPQPPVSDDGAEPAETAAPADGATTPSQEAPAPSGRPRPKQEAGRGRYGRRRRRRRRRAGDRSGRRPAGRG